MESKEKGKESSSVLRNFLLFSEDSRLKFYILFLSSMSLFSSMFHFWCPLFCSLFILRLFPIFSFSFLFPVCENAGFQFLLFSFFFFYTRYFLSSLLCIRSYFFSSGFNLLILISDPSIFCLTDFINQ